MKFISVAIAAAITALQSKGKGKAKESSLSPLIMQELLAVITKGNEQVVGPAKVEVLAVRAPAVVVLMIVGLRKH